MAAYREGKDNERKRETQGKKAKRKGREEPALDIEINQYENRYNAPQV